MSCPGGGVWVAVTREFERDNCVTSEILQSDWTIPNRAGVPRKVPRPSFVRESREGLGSRLQVVCVGPCVCLRYGSLEKLAVSFGVSVSINVMQSCVFSWVYTVLA